MSSDEFVGNSTVFPVLNHWAFFNHAGVSPLPAAAAAALRKFADEAESSAYLDATWWTDQEAFRAEAAQFINATKDEIAFVKNTSEGLCTIARGLNFSAGDRIITTAVEYPANMYPWMDVSRTTGAELITVPEETGPDGARRVSLDRILAEASHPRTRIITLSAVEFASGQRHDLATIGRFCREKGIYFCVDGIQILGVMPVDVQALGIDFLSADGHKWLLGPEGAGILYVRKELQEKVRPLTIGWLNFINPSDYGNYDFTFQPSAKRYECGSNPMPGLLALRASMQVLSQAGMEFVGQRIKALTDHAIAGLKSKGYQILSPRGQSEWSGIVSFVSPVHDHTQITKDLRTHKVEIALREKRLRISAHFYNTESQIDKLIQLLPSH